MSRKEDFKKASQSLENQVISNPWTLFEKGCEYGYQYAKKSFFSALTHYCNRHGIHPNTRVELISYLQKAMED